MAKNKQTIDFHAHILQQDIFDMGINKNVLTGFGMTPFNPEPGTDAYNKVQLCMNPALQVAEMDNRNIDVHVISSSTVMQGTQWADASTEAVLCRLMNDKTYEQWVKPYPDRFIGSMILPFQDLGLAIAELERCVSKYDVRVVNAPARVKDRYLSDPSFDPFWKKVSELGLVTFIHPHGVEDLWYQKYSLWNSIGQPIEEVKIISSLIYEGTLDKFPEAEIVISHGGGYLPLYMGRLDRNAVDKPWTTEHINGIPSDYIRRLKYDICVYDPLALERLLEFLGPDCLILGSDFPFGDKTPYYLLDQIKGLSKRDRNKITGGTARKLLKM